MDVFPPEIMDRCILGQVDPFGHPGLHFEVDEFGSGFELNSFEAVHPEGGDEWRPVVSSAAVYEYVFILTVELVEDVYSEANGITANEVWGACDADFTGHDVLMDGCILVGCDIKDGGDVSCFEQFMVTGIVSVA